MGYETSVAGTIRDMTRQLYAETVAAVEELFAENQAASPIRLSGVRVCCGSEAVNCREGVYTLCDGTPWLAELTFGADHLLTTVDSRSDIGAERSGCIAAWHCTTLQGVGDRWGRLLAQSGIRTIADLASLSHHEALELKQHLNTNRVLEFHRKALMATSACPVFPVSGLDRLDAVTILSMPEHQGLRLAPELSPEDWRRMTDFLGALVAVISDRHLSATTLGQLLDR
ncbi:hypothetical protein INT08_07295 [Prosthecochloris sp. N3]|uniref:DUF4332 domain-containing protein n=1 Tax=Prosthecochloris ethylica TaxID=2743976 RepID=A0ABR9XSR4_9CHLB|nr:hypothetical protein [Prosthecochloris ethylica]MBF0586672.1 hypothetical protein [Prosthecochloris ethylica]MBF0636974.1 hypothetical protein [Prosthecochloris ethylica]NUK47845.1 hypothetical protein [Prosthecochloris ethylica]